MLLLTMLRLLLLFLCLQQVIRFSVAARASNTLAPQGFNLLGTSASKQQKPRFKLKFVHRDDVLNSSSTKKDWTTKTPNGRPVRYYLPIYEEEKVVHKNKKNSTFQASKSRKKATLWLFSPDLLTSESAHSNFFHRAQHHQQQGHLFKQISPNNNNHNNNHHQHRHFNQINSRPARDNFNNNQRNQKHPNQIDHQQFPVKNGHQGPPLHPQNGHSNGNFNGHQNMQLSPNNGNQNMPQQTNRPNQLQQQPNFQTHPRQNQQFTSPNNNQRMSNFNNNKSNINVKNQQSLPPPNLMNNNKNVNAQPNNLNNVNPNQPLRPPINHPPADNGRPNNGNFNNVNHNQRPHNNNHHPNQVSNQPINNNKNGGRQNHNFNHNINNLNQNNIIRHINDHLNNPKPNQLQEQQPNYQHNNDNRNNEIPNENSKPSGDKYKEEVQSHNLDSEHFPHQYNIQIRWGKPGELGDLAKTSKNPSISSSPSTIKRKLPLEDRTMNDEKSRYRQFAHQEEEHWHDKKWINLGAAPKEVEDVSSLPENDQLYAVSQEKFKTLPVFVRPLRNDASIATIHEHFAVPSKSFPVNRRFVDWANAPVNMREHRIGVNGNNLSAESRRNFEATEMRRKRNNPENGNGRHRRGHWRRLRRFD